MHFVDFSKTKELFTKKKSEKFIKKSILILNKPLFKIKINKTVAEKQNSNVKKSFLSIKNIG